MAGQAHLSSHHNEVTRFGASRNPNLGYDNAPPAQLHVMGDLHQIINLAAGADDSVGAGAAVNCGVSPDFDVVFDDDPSQLGNLEVSLGTEGKTKSILADAHAGVDNNAAPDDAVRERGVGADLAIVAQDHAVAKDYIGANMTAATDFGTLADNGARVYPTTGAKDRRLADHRRGRNGRRHRRQRVK